MITLKFVDESNNAHSFSTLKGLLIATVKFPVVQKYRIARKNENEAE